MTRRNRSDHLTINRAKSKNWVLNFRVPKSHQTQHPFVARAVYQQSTKTSDYNEACRFRDEFFREHGLFGFSDEVSSSDVYWKTFSGNDQVSNEERELLQEVIEDTVGFGDKLPEPYASRIAGDLNRQESLGNPLATFQHDYPLHLETLHAKYLAYRSDDIAPKTVSRCHRAVRTFHEFLHSDSVDLWVMTKTLVFKYVRYLENSGLHETTIRGYLTSLNQVFDYAQRLGYITDERLNPFKGQKVRSVKSDEKPRVAIPLQHAQGLFLSAPNDELRLLIAVGHYSGIRLSEAFNMTIEYTDDQMVLRIADGGGKTHAATRQIPAHVHLQELICASSLYDNIDHAISWSTPNSDSLGKQFGRYKQKYFDQHKTDHKKYVFHSFRHAFSTYLVNKFGELKASELTGHDRSTASATELGRTYYSGLEMAQKREMVDHIPRLQVSPE